MTRCVRGGGAVVVVVVVNMMVEAGSHDQVCSVGTQQERVKVMIMMMMTTGGLPWGNMGGACTPQGVQPPRHGG
jgi:hypothetical protein